MAGPKIGLSRSERASARHGEAQAAGRVEEPTTTPWRTFGEMRDAFVKVRELVGETRYEEELRLAGAIIKETSEPSASALKSTNQAVDTTA